VLEIWAWSLWKIQSLYPPRTTQHQTLQFQLFWVQILIFNQCSPRWKSIGRWGASMLMIQSFLLAVNMATSARARYLLEQHEFLAALRFRGILGGRLADVWHCWHSPLILLIIAARLTVQQTGRELAADLHFLTINSFDAALMKLQTRAMAVIIASVWVRERERVLWIFCDMRTRALQLDQ